MRLLWACLCLVLLAAAPSAFAQSSAAQVVQGYLDANGKWHAYDTTGIGIPSAGGTVTSTPSITKGFGSLSLSATTSTLLSTLTAGPNSAVWPTTPGQTYLINDTTGNFYFCPFGGTCSATVGILILAGNAYGTYGMSTNATVFAANAGTVQAQW